MTFQTKIQSLATTHTQNNGAGVQSAAIWGTATNWQYGPSTGGVSGNFIVQMDMNDGSEIGYFSPGHGSQWPIAQDAHGVYITDLFKVLYQYDTVAYTLTQSLGVSIETLQGSYSPITNTSGDTWLLATGLGTQVSFEKFTCVKTSTTPMVEWGTGAVSFANYNATSCPSVPGNGLGYVVSGDNVSGTSAGGIRLWKVNVNVGLEGATLITTIAASTIDAGWTAAAQGGICVDQTDGHVLVFCNGQVGATHPHYLLKLNSSTGAIIWQTEMPGVGGGVMMGQSQIKSQIFCHITSLGGGANEITQIDTSDGSITTQFTTGMSGLLPYGSQAYNDQSGAIIGEFSYTEGTDSPIPLNSTPSSFGGWALIYVIAPPPAPPATGTHASQLRIWGNWH